MSWAELKERISGCRDCVVADCGRPLFMRGDPTGARVLFVMEEPNPDDTIKHGFITIETSEDETGATFNDFFTSELPPGEVLAVTNSALCLPPRKSGNNPITGEQHRNCSRHLRDVIELVKPAIVATLGWEALDAAGRIERHGLPGVTKCAGQHVPWFGRTLFPMSHPGGRGSSPVNRSEELQRGDWRKLGEMLAAL